MKEQKTSSYERRQTRSKRVAAVVAGLLAFLMLAGLISSALLAGAITKSEVDALKAKVTAATKKKNEIKNQLSTITSDLKNLEKQISLLDSQIESQEDEIDAQEELLAQLEQLVADKTVQLQESQAEEERQYGLMKDRVRYMAEHDNTSYLAILLSSDSFSDFLNRYEIVKQISLRDRDTFQALKAIRDQVAQEKADLEATQQEAKDTMAQMEQNKKELEAQRTAKAQRLEALQSSKSDAQKELAAMIEKEDELMGEYKKAAAELSAKSTYVGGTFMWPLPASNNVVTCKYGMRKHPITGKYKLHSGVDLRAGTGTKVYAANKGTVTTSAYSSAWGNYIIISHGGGVTTLYAHLSKRLVSKGDSVKQGDVIAQSGNTGYSTAPHLHFEISKNGSTYNPLTEFEGFGYVYK